MAAGDIDKEENCIVEVFSATDANINAGYIVTPYGNDGVAHALAGTSLGPYFMARMPPVRRASGRNLAGSTVAYNYSEDGTDDDVPCLVCGVGDVAVSTATDIQKGDYVEISSTAGKVQLSDHTNWWDIVGIAMEDIASASTHGLVLLGTYP